MVYFPGTLIAAQDNDVVSFFKGLFCCDTISTNQLLNITGLLQPTLQNWINRGYITRGGGKGFTKDSAARVFIINMLRDTLPLDKTVTLLDYLNSGNPSGEYISESSLYLLVCTALISPSFDVLRVNEISARIASMYPEITHEHREKLMNTIVIILKAYCAANIIEDVRNDITRLNQPAYCGTK